MFHLSDWPYILEIAPSGNLRDDVEQFLNANGKQHTLSHCIAVARTSGDLAVRFGADAALAETAALLHDVSAVVERQDMLSYAIRHNWVLDDAERKYPFLLHQRVSRVMAKDVFGVRDEAILSAIECHSTLRSNPSPLDMILFLSDKLSWDQAGVPPFYDEVWGALDHSLIHASRVYLNYVLEHGMILCPHQWFLDAKHWLAVVDTSK